MASQTDKADWAFLLKSFQSGKFPVEKVISVNEQCSVNEAFKILIDHKILALPIVDSKTGKFLSAISMLDIVGEIVGTFSEEEIRGLKETKLYDFLCSYIDVTSHKDQFKAENLKNFLQKRSMDLPLDPVLSINEKETVFTAVHSMVEKHAHRIFVVDNDGRLCNVITQSRILKFLLPRLDAIPQVTKSLKGLNLGFKKVVTISEKTMSYKAFRLMKEHKISGVAVVDDNGKIVGNISVNDLKLLQHGLNLFSVLSMSAKEYIKEVREIGSFQIRNEVLKKFQGESQYFTVHCSPEDSLETAIKMLPFFDVHRLYIVENGQPVGVISLNDILVQLFKK